VPNHPEVNFGTSDFSIDAWIYFVQYKSLVADAIILDKLQGGNQGYSFYVDNGELGLQLADGSSSGVTSYPSTILLPEGQWAHVAVTVERIIPMVLFSITME